MNNMELIKNSKEIISSIPVSQTLLGKYKTAIVDGDNNVIWEQKDWQKNLILNQGMEAVTSYTYANLTTLACAGTGDRANSFYTGTSSGSLSSTTITFFPSGDPLTGIQGLTASVAGYLQYAQVGDMVQFDDGTEQMITSVPSNTSLTVSPGGSAPLQPFTIWKTSQIGLQSLYRFACAGPGAVNTTAFGSYWFTGVGYCGSQTGGGLAPNVIGLRRTWDFAYETASVVYYEAGVGWSSNGNVTTDPLFSNTQVFSRVLLNPTVSLSSGQKIRLIYELDVAIIPYTGSTGGFPMTASITNWPISPATDLGAYYAPQGYDINGIDTNGNVIGFNSLEPAGGCLCFISNYSSSVLNAPGSRTTRGGSINTNVGVQSVTPYIPLSFQIYKNFLFQADGTGVFNPASLRTMGIGAADEDPTIQNSFVVFFNQNQTKTNTQTLGLTWIWNWGRVLS